MLTRQMPFPSSVSYTLLVFHKQQQKPPPLIACSQTPTQENKRALVSHGEKPHAKALTSIKNQERVGSVFQRNITLWQLDKGLCPLLGSVIS